MPKPEDMTDDNTEGTQGTVDTATTPPASEPQPKNDGDKSGPKTYTEAEYKGLQAVIAKRDGTIATQANKISELEAQLAEERANHGSAVTEKASLDSKLTEKETLVASLEKEVTTLQKKAARQEIIMKEFPDLAQAASYLPDVEADDEFREKAKELRTILKTHADTIVKDILGGASPSIKSDDTPNFGVDEEDRAYNEAVALAGVSGKEREYEAARDRYQAILEAKQKLN